MIYIEENLIFHMDPAVMNILTNFRLNLKVLYIICQMYIIDQNLLWASISNKSDWAGKPQITLGANNGAGSSITRSLPALPCQHFLWALIKSDQHFVSNFIRSLHWNHVRKNKRNRA